MFLNEKVWNQPFAKWASLPQCISDMEQRGFTKDDAVDECTKIMSRCFRNGFHHSGDPLFKEDDEPEKKPSDVEKEFLKLVESKEPSSFEKQFLAELEGPKPKRLEARSQRLSHRRKVEQIKKRQAERNRGIFGLGSPRSTLAQAFQLIVEYDQEAQIPKRDAPYDPVRQVAEGITKHKGPQIDKNRGG